MFFKPYAHTPPSFINVDLATSILYPYLFAPPYLFASHALQLHRSSEVAVLSLSGERATEDIAPASTLLIIVSGRTG